jgi:hypothetical protein
MKAKEQLDIELKNLHTNAIRKGARFSGTRLVSLKALCDTVASNDSLMTSYQEWHVGVEKLFYQIEQLVKNSSMPSYQLYKQSYTDVGLNLFERYQIGIAYTEEITMPIDISYRTPKEELKNMMFSINPIYKNEFQTIKTFADNEWEFTLKTIKESIEKEYRLLKGEEKNTLINVNDNLNNTEVNFESETSEHIEIQYYLIKVGLACNCQVFVANNDRNKQFNGEKFSDICMDTLPNFGFDLDTVKLIHNIDLLWIKNRQIIAAIEVENTTSIYSGLLRMADLCTLQPNNKIKCFIAAPNKRQEEFMQEINRPTFSQGLHLNEICKYISYSKIKELYSSTNKFIQPVFDIKIIDYIAINFSE